LVWDEAQKLNGVDPDFHRRDLYEAIESGAFPEWDFGVQIVDEEDEHKFDFDLLDATKIIPEELVPVKVIGRLTLNRNVDNFYAETEQVAFCTAHLVPGIDTSNDPLLQGRHFSYFDTQLSRLGGPNFEEIPINRPVCPVSNNQRDGIHRNRIDKGSVNYFPNRFGCPALANASQGGYVNAPTPVHGPKIRARGPKFAEHFNQARLFYLSLTDWEKEHLVKAASFELGHVEDRGVIDKMIDRLNHIDFDLAKQVAINVGSEPPVQYAGPTHNQTSAALSQDRNPKNTIKTRKIAFLVGPGYSSAQFKAVKDALEGLGANAVMISNTKGKQGGTGDEAQFTYTATRSVQYDAVFLVGGNHYPQMLKVGENWTFLNEAFKHGKPVIAVNEGVDFLAKLNFPEIQLAQSGEAFASSQGVVTTRNFDAETLKLGEAANFGKAVFEAIASHRFPKRNIEGIPA
jgi:catalase